MQIFPKETRIPFMDLNSHEALLRRREAGTLTWRGAALMLFARFVGSNAHLVNRRQPRSSGILAAFSQAARAIGNTRARNRSKLARSYIGRLSLFKRFP